MEDSSDFRIRTGERQTEEVLSGRWPALWRDWAYTIAYRPDVTDIVSLSGETSLVLLDFARSFYATHNETGVLIAATHSGGRAHHAGGAARGLAALVDEDERTVPTLIGRATQNAMARVSDA